MNQIKIFINTNDYVNKNELKLSNLVTIYLHFYSNSHKKLDK